MRDWGVIDLAWGRGLLALGAGVLLVGLFARCGARSNLGAEGVASGAGGWAAGGAGGAGGSSGGSGGEVPAACVLVPVGSPVEVMAFPDRSVIAPSLALLDAGESTGVASLALQGFASGGPSPVHPDIQLARLHVAATWPEGVGVDAGPTLVGVESHGWGELARAPGERDQLALAWFSDPGQVGRTAFRLLDVASWSPQPPVDISFGGSVALALEPGAGTGRFGVGYAGDGYALVWRETDDSPAPQAHPQVALLDAEGRILIGPHPAAQGLITEYPGFSPAAAWTGETYLLATALGDCIVPGCPAKLIVERVRPASGDGFDDSGVELVWGDSPELRPTGPTIDSHGGRTWLAWFYGDPDDAQAIRRLQLLELDPRGERLGEPATLTDSAWPASRAELTAGRHGVLIAYAEEDFTLPADALGRGRVIFHQLDHDGQPLGPPIAFYTTLMGNYQPPQAIAVADGAVVTWSAASLETGLDVVYLARLACAAPSPCFGAGDCSDGEFCDARCCGEAGFCKPVPEGCFGDCPEVLACGGDIFCNACEAQRSGVDAPEPGCPATTYRAEALDSTRVAITKAEPVFDRCLRVVIGADDGGSQPGIAVNDGWSVASFSVRQGVRDCHESEGAGWVEAIAASGAGSIELTMPPDGTTQCTVDADAVAQFPDGEPWVPELGAFAVADLPVAGCL
jgi:hypothetical protein